LVTLLAFSKHFTDRETCSASMSFKGLSRKKISNSILLGKYCSYRFDVLIQFSSKQMHGKSHPIKIVYNFYLSWPRVFYIMFLTFHFITSQLHLTDFRRLKLVICLEVLTSQAMILPYLIATSWYYWQHISTDSTEHSTCTLYLSHILRRYFL